MKHTNDKGPESMADLTNFTVVGRCVPSDPSIAAQIAEALMDCAADLDESGEFNASVSLNGDVIEIETMFENVESVVAFTRGRQFALRVCACAQLPVEFIDNELARPCFTQWQIDEPSPVCV